MVPTVTPRRRAARVFEVVVIDRVGSKIAQTGNLFYMSRVATCELYERMRTDN